MSEIVRRYENNIVEIAFGNDDVRAVVTNFGCTVMALQTRDSSNEWSDTILGMKTVDDYNKRDGSYMGAIVGRVCNRIKDGHFVLNDIEYNVPINNGPNSLHGGIEGFSYKVFDYTLLEDGVIFHYVSKDMEEGYPGTLTFEVTYTIKDHTFHISYDAVSDRDTILNFTNHMYFNLNGHKTNVLDHTLKIQSDLVGKVDENGLCTHEFMDVTNTPFDFREKTLLETALNQDHAQLKIAHGLDHSYRLNAHKEQVVLTCPSNGIEMVVSTSFPQVQIYSANFLNNQDSFDGLPMRPQDGICIETQFEPDCINTDHKDDVILRKGRVFHNETSYTFLHTERTGD